MAWGYGTGEGIWERTERKGTEKIRKGKMMSYKETGNVCGERRDITGAESGIKFTVFSHEEKSNGVRTDMTAGTVIIGSINESPKRNTLFDFFHNI